MRIVAPATSFDSRARCIQRARSDRKARAPYFLGSHVRLSGSALTFGSYVWLSRSAVIAGVMMRWTPGGASRNLEDRRGSSGGGGFGGGFGGGARLGVGGTLILLVLSVVFRQDFFAMVEGHSVGDPTATAPAAAQPAQSAQESRQVQFVSFVLDDAQNSWRRTLGALGAPYRDAKLVLFRNATRTGCGVGQTASGPFYCPADEKVYIDLSFYDELKRFGAAGDFAQAYVIAHELGHHVQHILGVDQQFRRAQQANPSLANALSVRFELQADCLAGVWGNSTAQRDLLDQADID